MIKHAPRLRWIFTCGCASRNPSFGKRTRMPLCPVHAQPLDHKEAWCWRCERWFPVPAKVSNVKVCAACRNRMAIVRARIAEERRSGKQPTTDPLDWESGRRKAMDAIERALRLPVPPIPDTPVLDRHLKSLGRTTC